MSRACPSLPPSLFLAGVLSFVVECRSEERTRERTTTRTKDQFSECGAFGWAVNEHYRTSRARSLESGVLKRRKFSCRVNDGWSVVPWQHLRFSWRLGPGLNRGAS